MMKTQRPSVFFLGMLSLFPYQFTLAENKPDVKPKPTRKVLTDAELIRSLPPKSATANKKKKAIYQWVDENGNTVISDKPHEGAVEVKLPKLQTYAPTYNDEGYAVEVRRQPESLDDIVPTIEITSPVNDSWLDNNLGNTEIRVAIKPSLGLEQQLIIKLDNEILSKGDSLTASVKELARGTHTVLAIVALKKTGKVITQKQTVFHVRRPFIKR